MAEAPTRRSFLHRAHVVDGGAGVPYPMRRLPTYAEIDRCIDLLDKLGKEYSLILKAEGTSVVPAMPYDWKKSFRVSWIV
jgi:hypothetical protein